MSESYLKGMKEQLLRYLAVRSDKEVDLIRKILVCLLVLGLLAGAVSMAAADDRVTIQFWTGATLEERISGLIDMFEEANPNIRVELKWISPGNMADAISLAAAADATPNVVLGFAGRNVSWYYQDLLEPLTDTLTKEEREDFYPGVLEGYTINDELFSYPAYQTLIVYFVNRTRLTEAGVQNLIPLDRELTQETWMAIAEKVVNLPNVYATCLFASGKGGDYYTLQYFQMFGANQFEGGDYSKTTLNSEAGVKALEWMISLVEKELVPPGPAGMTSQDHGRWMNSGRLAMFGGIPNLATPEWQAESLDQYWDWEVVQVPHVEGVPAPGLFPSPTSIVVFEEKDAEKKAAAIVFAKFLTSTEVQTITTNWASSFPTRKSVVTDLMRRPNYQFIMEYLAWAGMADLGINSPDYLEVRLARFPELQAAYMGTKTPKEALDDFAKTVEEMWAER